MTDSMVKRLWKKKSNKSKSSILIKRGLSLFSLCSSTQLVAEPEPVADTQLKRESATTFVPEHRLWRKPLPADCPLFDFSSSETLVCEEESNDEKDSIEIASIIPVRYASKFYGHIPDFEEQLERACNNKRAILLSKALGRH